MPEELNGELLQGKEAEAVAKSFANNSETEIVDAEIVEDQGQNSDQVNNTEGTGNSEADIQKYENALNTEGFVDFLEQNPDQGFDSENVEAVNAIYDAFLVKKQVVKSIRDTLIEGVEEQTGIADESIAGSIDSYITDLVYKNPDSVIDINSAYQELLTNLADLKLKETFISREMAKTGETEEITPEKIQEYELQLSAFQKARASLDLFNAGILSKENRDARKLAKQFGAKIKKGDLYVKIEETRRKISVARTVLELNAQKTVVDDVYRQQKKALFATYVSMGSVANDILGTFERKVREMRDGSVELGGLDQAVDLLYKMEQSSNDSDGAINYLDGLDLETMKKTMDEKAEQIMINEVMNKLGDRPNNFAFVATELSKYLEDGKRIGTQSGQKAKDAVEKALRSAVQSPKISKQNKIMIKGFLTTKGLTKFKI